MDRTNRIVACFSGSGRNKAVKSPLASVMAEMIRTVSRTLIWMFTGLKMAGAVVFPSVARPVKGMLVPARAEFTVVETVAWYSG